MYIQDYRDEACSFRPQPMYLSFSLCLCISHILVFLVSFLLVTGEFFLFQWTTCLRYSVSMQNLIRNVQKVRTIYIYIYIYFTRTLLLQIYRNTKFNGFCFHKLVLRCCFCLWFIQKEKKKGIIRFLVLNRSEMRLQV